MTLFLFNNTTGSYNYIQKIRCWSVSTEIFIVRCSTLPHHFVTLFAKLQKWKVIRFALQSPTENRSAIVVTRAFAFPAHKNRRKATKRKKMKSPGKWRSQRIEINERQRSEKRPICHRDMNTLKWSRAVRREYKLESTVGERRVVNQLVYYCYTGSYYAYQKPGALMHSRLQTFYII